MYRQGMNAFLNQRELGGATRMRSTARFAHDFDCGSKAISVDASPVEPCPPFALAYNKVLNDGKYLAVADEAGWVYILDTQSDELPHSLHWDVERPPKARWLAHQNTIFDVAWAKNDSVLYTANGDHEIGVWDTTTAQLRCQCSGHAGSVKVVRPSESQPDVFVSGARDGAVMVWDLRTPARWDVPRQRMCLSPVATITAAHARPKSGLKPGKPPGVTALAFIKGDTALATAGAHDSTVKLWDIRALATPAGTLSTTASTTPSSAQRGGGRNSRAGSKQAGAWLSVACPSSSARLHGVTSLAVSPAGDALLVSTADSTHHVYSVTGLDKAPMASLRGYQAATFYVKGCFSPDGRSVVSGSTDGKLYIWDLDCPSASPRTLSGHNGEATAVAWCPSDWCQLASCGDDATVRVWSLQRGREQQAQQQQNQQETWSTKAADAGPADMDTDIAPADVGLLASSSDPWASEPAAAAAAAERRASVGVPETPAMPQPVRSAARFTSPSSAAPRTEAPQAPPTATRQLPPRPVSATPGRRLRQLTLTQQLSPLPGPGATLRTTAAAGVAALLHGSPTAAAEAAQQQQQQQQQEPAVKTPAVAAAATPKALRPPTPPLAAATAGAAAAEAPSQPAVMTTPSMPGNHVAWQQQLLPGHATGSSLVQLASITHQTSAAMLPQLTQASPAMDTPLPHSAGCCCASCRNTDEFEVWCDGEEQGQTHGPSSWQQQHNMEQQQQQQQQGQDACGWASRQVTPASLGGTAPGASSGHVGGMNDAMAAAADDKENAEEVDEIEEADTQEQQDEAQQGQQQWRQQGHQLPTARRALVAESPRRQLLQLLHLETHGTGRQPQQLPLQASCLLPHVAAGNATGMSEDESAQQQWRQQQQQPPAIAALDGAAAWPMRLQATSAQAAAQRSPFQPAASGFGRTWQDTGAASAGGGAAAAAAAAAAAEPLTWPAPSSTLDRAFSFHALECAKSLSRDSWPASSSSGCEAHHSHDSKQGHAAAAEPFSQAEALHAFDMVPSSLPLHSSQDAQQQQQHSDHVLHEHPAERPSAVRSCVHAGPSQQPNHQLVLQPALHSSHSPSLPSPAPHSAAAHDKPAPAHIGSARTPLGDIGHLVPAAAEPACSSQSPRSDNAGLQSPLRHNSSPLRRASNEHNPSGGAHGFSSPLRRQLGSSVRGAFAADSGAGAATAGMDLSFLSPPRAKRCLASPHSHRGFMSPERRAALMSPDWGKGGQRLSDLAGSSPQQQQQQQRQQHHVQHCAGRGGQAGVEGVGGVLSSPGRLACNKHPAPEHDMVAEAGSLGAVAGGAAAACQSRAMPHTAGAESWAVEQQRANANRAGGSDSRRRDAAQSHSNTVETSAKKQRRLLDLWGPTVPAIGDESSRFSTTN